MKNIIFTGGGTAGHVLPNFPLIKKFLQDGWNIGYIGAKNGIEKSLVTSTFPEIKYFEITCDKLRRYLTYKHIFVPFRLFYGLLETIKILHQFKPKYIFSKGGFVSVPIVIAAKILNIPIIIHESDYSVGLANKIAFPFAKIIAVSFPHLKSNNRTMVIGPLLDEELFMQKNIDINFNNPKKIILVIGGSLGAKIINNLIYDNLRQLTADFNIIHICGKGHLPTSTSIQNNHSYKVFEYVSHEDLIQLLYKCNFVISRAGINSLWEIMLVGRPAILIPLSAKNSRGDQIENAHYFKKLEAVMVLDEDNINKDILINAIHDLDLKENDYLNQIKSLNIKSGVDELYEQIITM